MTAAVQKDTAKPAPKRLIVQRMPSRASSSRIEWDVTVDVGTTVEDLLRPEFWANVSGSTFHGANNLVNVYWEDKSQVAELYVRFYDSTSAKMELLDHWEFDKADIASVADKYDISWQGPNTKFRVTRLSDAQEIKSGLSSKEDALAWLHEHKEQIK